MPNWTEEQINVIRQKGCNMLVAAAAGSGKTAVMVERIIRSVLDDDAPVDIDRIVVVTFTRAAAAQMKERIARSFFAALGTEKDEKKKRRIRSQISLLDNAVICTIDSFCNQILRNYFNLIDLDPSYRIGDEGELKLMMSDVADEVIEAAYESKDQIFYDFVEKFFPIKREGELAEWIIGLYSYSQSYPFPEEWLDMCRKEYEIDSEEELENSQGMRFLMGHIKQFLAAIMSRHREVIQLLNGAQGFDNYVPAFVSDCAYFEGAYNSHNYNELKSRLDIEYERLGRLPKDADPDIKKYAQDVRKKHKKYIENLQKDMPGADVADILETLREIRPYVEKIIELVLDFVRRYDTRKGENGILSFSDVEHLALKVLVNYENGDYVKTYAAGELSRLYEEIYIDEYQDSNMVQEIILSSISRGNNMFMVGDIKQSIYAFRQADPEIFLDKYNSYANIENIGKENADKEDTDTENAAVGGADPKNVLFLLRKNFRSRKNVLFCVNDIFERIMHDNIGGVEYDDNARLIQGRSFGDGGDNAQTEADGTESGINGTGNWSDATELLLCDMKSLEADNDSEPEKGKEIAKEPVRESEAEAAKEPNADEKNKAEDAEDEEEKEKRQIIALAVAGRIKELVGDNPYPIWDDSLNDGEGGMRPARYSDIVILLRSANVAGPEYAKVLNDEQIPAICNTSYGYFSANEVAEILNLLCVIDNPRQDIPLAGALRSYFCYLTAQELALVRGCASKTTLYDAVLRCASGDDGLAGKLKCFIDFIDGYRKKAAYLPIHELIRMLIYETDYIVYVSSKENGRRRAANLDMLIEKAMEYEKTSYHGLFGFLRYIEKIKKYEIDTGEVDILSENDDVVRIMSIHKSKGLEFPIVFVGDMEKKYNFRDLYEQFIFNDDYGIGMDDVNLKLRVRKRSFNKRVVAQKNRLEIIGEELRVLYVALTRASQKLILAGAVADADSFIGSSEYMVGGCNYADIYSLNSYLELVMPAFIAKKTGKYEIRTSGIKDIEECLSHKDDNGGRYKNLSDRLDAAIRNIGSLDKELEKSLYERLHMVYKYEKAVRLPSKFSVSELKHMVIDENEDEAVHILQTQEKKPVLRILSEAADDECGKEASDNEHTIEASDDGRGMEKNVGAIRGDAYHKIFELFDYSLECDRTAIADFIGGLVADGKISDEYAGLVSPYKFMRFLNTDLGKRMRVAALSGRLYRERQFVTGFPAWRLREEYEGCDDTVLVQGIIDAYFEEADGIAVVDYKTDHVDEENAKDIFAARYTEQLKLYKDAVEQITGKKVNDCIIYSVSINKDIVL